MFMYEKNIVKFNYKLNGILNINLNESKWNLFCGYCLVVEDIEYFLYKCMLVENIWRKFVFRF